MSYSFHEVVPFFFTKHNDEIYFNSQEIIDSAGDCAETELNSAFEHLTSPSSYMVGQKAIFDIPEFTATSMETGEARTFEAKSFILTINEVDKELEDSGEGNHSYSYVVKLTDDASGEHMIFYTYYYAAIDHILLELECYIDKEAEKEETKSMYAVVENMWPEGFLMHGIFTSVDKAITGYNSVKKQNASNHENVTIEEIPMNTGLVYNEDQVDTYLRGCKAVYNLEGKKVKSFM